MTAGEQDPSARARRLWRLLETVHGPQYFAPDARQRFEAVGLKGFWMGYFASRAAAFGPVGPEFVEATFYVFHRSLVRRAIPDAWTFSSPEAVLKARYELAENTLQGALGELADGKEVDVAAELAVDIAQTAPLIGRPFGAAHAAAPLPDGPLMRLWWAATVLREHRWDGHMAALISAELDGAEAMILAAAHGDVGANGAELLKVARGWPDDEWDAAGARLVDRGLIGGDGAITDAGRALKQQVEDSTDRAASVAYVTSTAEDLDTMVEALYPLARQIADDGALPYPNPLGLDPKKKA